jgi:hypothetical protein
VNAEALTEILALKQLALEPKRLDIADPTKARFIVDGEIREYDLPATPRSHKVHNLEALISLANRFNREVEVGDDGEGDDSFVPVVWFDRDAVVLVIDDAGHRVNSVTLNLETSDTFAKLKSLYSGQTWYDQRGFVRLLAVDFARCIDAGILLNKVRKIKFDSGVSGAGVIGRASESMGHNINSRVESAEGEIPEVVTVMSPVFKTNGETQPFPVQCSVEINPQESKFRLMPLPDQIELVTHAAVADIGDRLASSLDKGIEAYFGKP